MWYLDNVVNEADIAWSVDDLRAILYMHGYVASVLRLEATYAGIMGFTEVVSANPFRFGAMYWDSHTQTYTTPNRHLNPRTGPGRKMRPVDLTATPPCHLYFASIFERCIKLNLDFFEATQETIHDLNKTERLLFDYVVKNMDKVKRMRIREFAADQFLSTTTIFRFTKKLGFSGYEDFIQSLIIASHNKQDTIMPDVVMNQDYSEGYLKNIMESIRVMSPKQVDKVVELLTHKPNIYILTDDNTHTIGQYCERLFIGLNLHAYFPETAYQMKNLANRIGSQDMIISLSYSGKDTMMNNLIKRVFLKQRPHLLSITCSENNPLESLSDTNFYVFADEIIFSGMNLTSNVTMLMIIELLAYKYIAVSKSSK